MIMFFTLADSNTLFFSFSKHEKIDEHSGSAAISKPVPSFVVFPLRLGIC